MEFWNNPKKKFSSKTLHKNGYQGGVELVMKPFEVGFQKRFFPAPIKL
jgi:hypothetical protein